MTAAPVASHKLAAPTVQDFRTTVQRVARAEFDKVWADACARAGVSRAALNLDEGQLGALAQALSAIPGVVGVIGKSLAVRMTSYRTLSSLAGAKR